MVPTRQFAGFARLLDRTPAAVFVVDDDLQIVYANSACCELGGIEPGRLVGQSCRYHSDATADEAAAFAAALCPPPDAFDGLAARVELVWPAGSGAATEGAGEYVVAYQPLGAGDDVAGVLGVVTPRATAGGATMLGAITASESAQLHAEIARHRAERRGRYALEACIGLGPAMQRVRAQIALACANRVPTLILGAEGTGRRHVARTIHYARSEAAAELTELDCRRLPPDAQRAELAGLVARLQAAEGDVEHTLICEHVDEAPLDVQVELIATCEAGIAGLWICGTATEALTKLAAAGEFRDDLACLLATLVVELPPLSDRPEDVPLLCQYFLETFNATSERQLAGFTAEALDPLTLYAWPGNVTELAEVVRSACQQAESRYVGVTQLPEAIRLASSAFAHPRRPEETVDLAAFLAKIERELIERALDRAGSNKAKAARMLGMTRPRLYRRLVQLGLATDEPDGDAGE